MAALSFRAPRRFRATLICLATTTLAACSSSSAPPSFGDAAAGRDAGRNGAGDAAKDGARRDSGSSRGDTGGPGHDAAVGDVGAGDAAPETPCTSADQCASKVCAPAMKVGPAFQDGGLGCATPGAACKCQPSTCMDHVLNGLETDIDCGGGECPKCADGAVCQKGGTDCVSGECGVGTQGGDCVAADAGAAGCTCQPPTCDDGVKNGTESDVDCGSNGTCPVGETCTKCTGCTTGKVCDAPSDCLSDTCTAAECGCPTGMTEASTSLNVPYCIDAYEATYNAYTAFKNGHSVSEQPAFCAWNKTYAPSANFPQLPAWSTLPVTNVNWCDAYMFCHTQGKHLCGQIADSAAHVNEGDPIDASNANEATKDEWFNACSDQGANLYPYNATTYVANTCNGADSSFQAGALWQQGCLSLDPGNASPVPTVGQGETASSGPPCQPPAFFEDTCIGGTSNMLFDMSGNVAEWENACASSSPDAGETDKCNVRGGSYKSTEAGLTCKTSYLQPQLARSATADDVGIRCCL